ncbi:MAG: sulfotransferase [Rhodospirillales bacterium]
MPDLELDMRGAGIFENRPVTTVATGMQSAEQIDNGSNLGRVPNFFVVGAAKSATTTLHAILDRHSEVYCPPLKEPGFFADDDAPGMFDPFSGRPPFDGASYVRGAMAHHEQVAYITDLDVYRQLYRRVGGEKIVGDFSTAYLCSVHAAARIKAFDPKAKILMILREPIDRAISHYKMDRAIGLASSSFSDLIAAEMAALLDQTKVAHRYIRLGLYAEQVERYLKEFPIGQVKIVLFEDIKNAREKTLREIEAFLGVSHEVAQLDLVVNKSEQPRSRHLVEIIDKLNIRPLIRRLVPKSVIAFGKSALYKPYAGEVIATPDDVARLQAIFAPDVKRLSAAIDRDLSAWQSAI